MKKILVLSIIIFLVLTTVLPLYGESDGDRTFVVRHKMTKEVYTVSNKNDTVPPEGFEVIEIPMKMEEKDFPINPTLCYYDEGKFKPKVQKINKINNDRKKWDEHVNNFLAAKKSARNKLKALGFTKAEIDAIFREGDYLSHQEGENDIENPIPSYVDIIDISKIKDSKDD